jgi:hypothetical protein
MINAVGIAKYYTSIQESVITKGTKQSDLTPSPANVHGTEQGVVTTISAEAKALANTTKQAESLLDINKGPSQTES